MVVFVLATTAVVIVKSVGEIEQLIMGVPGTYIVECFSV